MKSKNKLSFVIGIILVSISSIYPSNINKGNKSEPTKKVSFWASHELNWKNTNQFNINPYWNQNETSSFNERTTTISNKKISASKDDSFQDNKGNNKPTNHESGNIRWKGYRFQNLNIPANAIITNVELMLTGYKHGKTTVSIKAEKLKSPNSYSSNKNYLSTRSTTSESVNWYIPKLSNGTQIKSPNLKDVVQEVVNSEKGVQNLSLIISSSAKWESWNFDDRSSSYYPKINISYTIGTPDLSDDKHTMDENTVATIAVFNNDDNVTSNGSLKISTAAKNGTAKITDPNNTANNPSDDVITYTPNNNFDGTDSFTYQVCDSSNNCDTATVSITINSVVDPCDAAASGNLDTDNDGVADICDLDDDNDGILDTDECPAVNPFSFQLNANNKKFTNSGISGDIGDVMLYRNVGKKNNQKIDLKITVTANSDPQNMTVDISGFKFGDDLYPVLLGGENKKDTPSATVKFEFLKSGTNELINVAPAFMFKDVDFLNDGTGESVEINKNLVSSYALSKNPETSLYIVDNITTNYVGTSGNFLRVNSKKEAGGLNNEDMWIGLQLLEVNSFNINFLKRTGNTGYVFESDSFSKTANTIQLDADCALDTDNDSIPDYLDTDSDNDGCPDATEAEKNMVTTAKLANGSNGGSSANLGTKSNKNGIPLPFGTANGNETKGQKTIDATKTAEKITINTTEFNITKSKHINTTLTIDATATKTNTFANGVPNYATPNGTDTSGSLTYNWFKTSNPTKSLSTSKTLNFYYLRTTDAGEYTVTISSANSSCAEESTFTLTINDVPIAKNDWLNAKEDEANTSLNVLNNDYLGDDDATSGQITLMSNSSEKNGTISINDNGTPNNPKDDTIFYTSALNYNGSDAFEYTITDASGDTSTAKTNIYVNATNDLPTAKNDAVTIDENSNAISIIVTNNDDFGGDGPSSGQIFITDSRSDQKGSITVDNNGTNNNSSDDKITYTPPTNFSGTDTFTYNIQDANGDGSKATVTITINNINTLPTAVADAVNVVEDSTNNIFDVLNNDDFGSDGYSNTAITLVSATTIKGGALTVNNNSTPNSPSDDSIIYTPLANFNGQDTFEYIISDKDGDKATALVTINVTSTNDVPTANSDSITVDEDSSNNIINVLVNDSFGGDGSNVGTILISDSNSDKGGTISVDNNDTATDPTDDTINYTPLANFNGNDTFNYKIEDSNGDFATATVNITVNSINDLPTAINDVANVSEDSTENYINILTNDDFGGDGQSNNAITLVATTSNKGGTISVNNNNTPNNPSDDAVLYSPAENFNGEDTFQYTIKDANGDAVNATVTVTVNPVNDLPIATADSISVDEDAENITISVLANDSFGGDGSNDGTITLALESSEKGGTISVNDNNTATDPTDDKISYKPATNYNGTDAFEYTITDANGDTATAKVTITVKAVNDLPSAVNDMYTVDEDSSNIIIAIFDNDSYGGDGQPIRRNTEVSTPNKGGKVLIRVSRENSVGDSGTDIVYYTPAPDFNGTETFTYTISDADGDKSTATVTIIVNNVNDNPVTIDDNLYLDENSLNVSIDVLKNDSFGGDQPKSGAISISSDKSNKGGTIIVDDNATPTDPTDDKIVYTPLANYAGLDSFTYTITDSDDETATGTVTINLTPKGTQYNPLAFTECFNIFVQNNLTLSKGNTSGSVAAGGDLTFNENYEIASKDCGCFAVNDVKIGLLVGGKVNYPTTGVLSLANENQYAKIGEDNNATVWYKNPENSESSIRITPASNYNATAHIQLAGTSDSFNVSKSVNPITVTNIIDFESAFQQLQDVSLSLASEINNAVVLNTDYQEISNTNLPSDIVINLENRINYLNITGEDLNKVTKINFFEKPAANRILIININADATFNWNVWQQTAITAEQGAYIIYNFYNTKTLNINGTNEIIGSVFASFADISKTTNSAAISGQIIGKSLTIEDGTINCAIFENDVYSPEDVKIAPTADFTINNNNQCFVNNNFSFLNASNIGTNIQPTAPITYAWDFGNGATSSLMNPSFTYTESGTYNVKLTATNVYGSSEKILQVTVAAIIVADAVESNSTKDQDEGTVTKEFTLNNNADFTNFTWSINGFDTSSFDNQKTILLTFTEEGEHILKLKTINNNCDSTVEIPITITSDEVSTGNDGGLESESLGDAISIRYFQRKRKNVPTIFKKTSKNLYNKKKMVKSLAKKSNELSMLEMFPEKLVEGDVAHITSPTDILDFTVADEVLSVDFSVDNKTIGVVLGVKTLDQIYNHTKATCDRLRGAEILNVKTVEIGGYNFLQQAIKQRSGVIEHAISFAITKNKTEEFYNIQTNWYVFDYKAANDVFNFQVWASEPANTVKMVTEILANLNNAKPVEQIEKQKTPKSFVTKVDRVADKLNLNLKSFEATDAIEIAIDEKLNETTTELNSRYTPLKNQKEQTLQLDINDGYEYDGDISFDGEIQDAFYHADGNWGLEYDRRYTTVNEYEVSNNLDREYADDELPINRNVSIKAYSEYDYLAVYKSLLPGTISADYSAYKYLSFTASGQGPTQLVLVKAGIENWSEQYRATVNLTAEPQTFFIPFESFTSIATTDKIVADNLTTVSFTYVAVDAGTNDLDLKISDVKFTKTNTALSTDTFVASKNNEFFAYPNPSKGDLNCTIFSDNNTTAKATLTDITGKVIYQNNINLSAGKNELKFNFKAKAGVLFLKINSNEINYGTSKIIFK